MREEEERQEDYEYEEPLPEDFLFDAEEEAKKDKERQQKAKMFRIIGIIIAFLLILQGGQSLFSLYSRDSVDLARTSEQYNESGLISKLKEAVVTIQGQGSKGTGFSIHPDGYILTNHHVIDKRNMLAVVFPDGTLYHAETIAQNEELDIALLKVDGENLPYLPIRHESALEHETIYVIGNPLSQTQIVNQGEVINDEIPFQTMRISAPIYPGHSGSPVLSESGEVVGVVYARTIPSLGSGEQSHGLAVPIERVVLEFPILNELIEK